MIELTHEQLLAVDAQNGSPALFVDGRTRTTYVLVRSETYERFKQTTQSAIDEIPIGIRQARAAFCRDLPAMLANRRMRGKYVCYHRDGLAAVARDYMELIKECNRRGFPEDEYLIEKVVPGERADEEEID